MAPLSSLIFAQAAPQSRTLSTAWTPPSVARVLLSARGHERSPARMQQPRVLHHTPHACLWVGLWVGRAATCHMLHVYPPPNLRAKLHPCSPLPLGRYPNPIATTTHPSHTHLVQPLRVTFCLLPLSNLSRPLPFLCPRYLRAAHVSEPVSSERNARCMHGSASPCANHVYSRVNKCDRTVQV